MGSMDSEGHLMAKVARKAKTPANKGASRKPGGRRAAGSDVEMIFSSSDPSLPVSLLRTREAVLTHMRPILRAHGVTEQQWRVLRSLNEKTPISKTLLADRSTLLMPSLLRILKDLERVGWLEMPSSTTNARLSDVKLTKEGAAYARKVAASLSARNRIIKGAIGDDKVSRLFQLLGEVEAELSKLSF